MRCTCYCTASSYDIPRLLQHLHPSGPSQPFRDIIHTQNKGDVFYFSHGCVVCWGLTEEEEKQILQPLKEFEKESLAKHELDELTFEYSKTFKIEEDEIFLHDQDMLTKLAVSHGIAQSVKLSTFEERIQKTTEHTKKIPIDLAQKGKISLSRKEISKKMGEIFIERSYINLHSEILDIPEFFWDYPELEPYYRRMAQYLDVTKRAEALNRRLSVVHELFEILSAELNHQHSTRLEMIIIYLILIEVTLSLLQHPFHLI